jgi:predicted metalloprotease
MRFNPKARLDTSRVRVGGGGLGGGGLGGGGMRVPLPGGTRAGGGAGLLLIILVIVLLKACGGVDLTGAIAGDATTGYNTSRFQGDDTAYQSCTTGQDANEHPTTCGVVAVENSLVDYWRDTLSQQSPRTQFKPESGIVTFSGATPTTGCGQASSQMGPFYCPTDQTIYFDPSFFHDILQQQLNGPSGAFVEPYVIAHEFGHHVQNLLGTMSKVRTQQGRNSDSVRLELQADCYAGMWTRSATQTQDSQGNVLIENLSDQDIQDAIAAAKSVGDDTIQQETTGKVSPEQWTHGSSASRVRWFETGYDNGTLDACDTFNGQDVD